MKDPTKMMAISASNLSYCHQFSYLGKWYFNFLNRNVWNSTKEKWYVHLVVEVHVHFLTYRGAKMTRIPHTVDHCQRMLWSCEERYCNGDPGMQRCQRCAVGHGQQTKPSLESRAVDCNQWIDRGRAALLGGGHSLLQCSPDARHGALGSETSPSGFSSALGCCLLSIPYPSFLG